MVLTQESQGGLCIGNRETHHSSRGFTAVKSLLFVFDSPAGSGERAPCPKLSLSQLCSVGDGTVIRQRTRMKTTRGITSEGNDGREKRKCGKKVCERLTFPFLLWGLVVKRFPDILTETFAHSRLPGLRVARG